MSIQKTILIYKALGETPLEALIEFKRINPLYKDVPMTYAGRLDPMAEGLLLVLSGEECKKKDEYLELAKEYEGEILLGVSTDTGDVLGLTNSTILKNYRIGRERLAEVAGGTLGKQKQEYPAYSSKTVAGKPLWKFAREGEDVEKPIREIEIYEFEVTSLQEIPYYKFINKVIISISQVRGDFRQEEIISAWQELKGEVSEVQIVSFKCRVSSGTYVRALTERLGRELGISACLLSLKRTKIGDWKL